MHLLQRLPIFASLLHIGLEPACQRLGERIKLARPFRRRKLRLNGVLCQMLANRNYATRPSAAKSRGSTASVASAYVE
jgi:hypothetical protein